ncbi:MAG: DUF2254 family protein [Tissierellia bacterium]|nr:DUF2254 family protein [Tissierellia bacterium]
MFNKIKIGLLNHRNIIRIVKYILISVVLLWVSWFFDYRSPQLKKALPKILLLSPEVTSSFLSNLSGTFLTVTTFTFTTILTVLGKYSDSFSPRIVQDFIDKPNVLSLVGIYIGGFFYTVLALFMVQNIDLEVPLVGGTLAVFYAIAAMISFILFVRRVLADIKLTSVVDNIYDKAYRLIQEEAKRRKASERFESEDCQDTIKIYANKTGFFYDIDSQGLLSQLKEVKGELVIDKKIGQYLSKGVYIAELRTFEKLDLAGEEKEDFLSKLASFLLVNDSKNDHQDYHHEITNLVEIALKALSPGINDPNSAIEAIQKLSLLLGQLFSTENFYVVLNESDQLKIIYNGYSVQEELTASFAQIIHYGKADPLVAKAILESLYMVYMISAESVKGHVKAYVDAVYKICRQAMATDLDKRPLDAIYQDFSQHRDEHSNEEAIREED